MHRIRPSKGSPQRWSCEMGEGSILASTSDEHCRACWLACAAHLINVGDEIATDGSYQLLSEYIEEWRHLHDPCSRVVGA